jgi:hypothetical protein
MATTTEMRAAYEFLGLSLTELWMAYFEVGGNHPADHLQAYLDGDDTTYIDARERDHIIDALNDSFVERGHDHPLTYGGT